MDDEKQKRFNDAVKRLESMPESQAIFNACKRAQAGPMCLGCNSLRAELEAANRRVEKATAAMRDSQLGWEEAEAERDSFAAHAEVLRKALEAQQQYFELTRHKGPLVSALSMAISSALAATPAESLGRVKAEALEFERLESEPPRESASGDQ